MKNIFIKLAFLFTVIVPLLSLFAAAHLSVSDESSTPKTFAETKTYCADLSTAPADPNDPNDTDWQVPNVTEIVDFSGITDDSYIWTKSLSYSTTGVKFTTIRLDSASILMSLPSDPNIFARCVRYNN